MIYNGFTDLLSDSLAFDGTYLYVVEGEARGTGETTRVLIVGAWQETTRWCD